MPAQLSLSAFTKKLVAHRGWPQRYPENSYAGIKAALELGLQHIEIDVHLSADLIPIVCHDHNLMRLCGIDQDVRETPLADIKNFSFHEPSRLQDKFIPTSLMTLSECAELIAQYPLARLYVEIKRQSLYHFGREAVLNAISPVLDNIKSQASLISFDVEVLQLAHTQQLGFPLIPVLLDIEQWHSDELKQLNPPMIFCDDDDLEQAQALKASPYPAVVYEIDDYDKAMDLLANGAIMIESFCCGELIAAHAARIQA